ncbi:uncharacterized protein METZ01_LOCUS293965 [marine metagenome]|uniref:DUF2490 domain-containing protein n=1 Tax=marine metagenome TaxID=408172 RepID=A0A382M1S5_9ZZZZ
MRTILSKLIILLILPFAVYPQENDFQVWTCFSARKKIIKKTTLTVKEGLRFRENATLISKQFTEARIRYKYNKHWFPALGYRYSLDWDNNQKLEKKNRFYADISYKNKFKRFNFSVRSRILKQGNSYDYENVFRQRFSIFYNIRKTKLEPFSAIEYFYTPENKFDKLRYTIAISYPIIKDLDMEIAYRIQEEFNTNNPDTFYIFEGKINYYF